jgi:hypothetical protein
MQLSFVIRENVLFFARGAEGPGECCSTVGKEGETHPGSTTGHTLLQLLIQRQRNCGAAAGRAVKSFSFSIGFIQQLTVKFIY